MSPPRACFLWPDCHCEHEPCPELPAPAGASPRLYTPVLSRAETIARLAAWAEDMLRATPSRTGALHLLDAVHYLHRAPSPEEIDHA